MNILKLEGLSPELFMLVGPLAMNPKVLKANNNYPFKTTERFEWYIAMEDGSVVGFVPVEKKSSAFVINNYYVQDDNEKILKALLKAVEPKDNLQAVVQTKHEEIFAKCNFCIEHRWTNYLKMTYHTNNNE
ncbi:MAG: hypothetical protein Q4D36_11625 [Bacteroidales bacterium]|nr:hypothetical protein [Bacteroidales bacterium]